MYPRVQGPLPGGIYGIGGYFLTAVGFKSPVIHVYQKSVMERGDRGIEVGISLPYNVEFIQDLLSVLETEQEIHCVNNLPGFKGIRGGAVLGIFVGYVVFADLLHQGADLGVII